MPLLLATPISFYSLFIRGPREKRKKKLALKGEEGERAVEKKKRIRERKKK